MAACSIEKRKDKRAFTIHNHSTKVTRISRAKKMNT